MTNVADQDFIQNRDGSVGDPNDKCIPRFFYKEKHMVAESLKEGRPIFTQDTMVEILIPGQKSPVTRKIIDADKERWPIQWFKFEKMGDTKIEGTPIEQWPQLTVSQVGVLKSLNVLSIEAISTLDDALMVKLGPDGRVLRDKAKRFLEISKDTALADKQAARIDDLERQIKELRDAQKPAETPKESQAVTTESPKKRGRPKKVQA